MLKRYPGHRWLLTVRLLSILADQGDRLEIRRRVDGGYEVAEWSRGVPVEWIYNPRFIRGLPAALVSFESFWRRTYAWLTWPFRRLGSAGWSGRFDLPVGPDFTAEVVYRVRWRWWQLVELDVRIAGAPLAEIARVECNLLMPI